MNQFVPGIPVKRYTVDIHPEQGRIPMIIKMVAIRDSKIVEGECVPNRAHYSKYKKVIQHYIDEEGYND